MPAPGKQARPSVTRQIGALLCVAFAIWSVLWLWAALLTVRAEKLITLWEQQPANFDPQQAAQLMPRIRQSLFFNPSDANTHFLLARLHELLGDAHLAEEQYRIVLGRQPTWDYAWARLANFYSEQDAVNGSLDERILQALVRAMTLGPYEAATQHIVIPLIFEYWEPIAAAPATRNKALRILAHALESNSTGALAWDAGARHGQLALLESLVNNELQRKTLRTYRAGAQRLDAKHR